MRTKKGIAILIAILAVVGGVVYYRYFFKTSSTSAGESAVQANKELTVSAVATYKVPKGEDKVRFTLTLDGQGAVVDVKTTDALKNDAVSENLAKFSANLLLAIKGKKLIDLQAVDKVGTSSLTTAAFNGALAELKAQL